jgi:hypothetical protein
MIRSFTLAVLMIALGATAVKSEAPVGTVTRLSPEQIAAIEDAKLNRADTPATATVADLGATPKRRFPVQGEAGFAVGTGGYTAFFGTVVTPLGDDGFAAFSFETQNYGRNRRRR